MSNWLIFLLFAWDIPRSTHNYFVDNLLAGDLPSVRQKLLCQYVGFFQKLRSSACWEVRVLANTVGADAASVTGKNLRNLQAEFDLCPWTMPVWIFKKKFMGYQVPDEDGWRISLLRKLLRQRREMSFCDEDISTITGLIDSRCVS